MNLSRLPRIGHWDVALLLPPGRDVGIVIVQESGSKAIRAVTPATMEDGLVGALANAAARPDHGKPARPKALRCHEDLREALLPIAKMLGATVQVVQELPLLDAAFAALVTFADAPTPDEMIPLDIAGWLPLFRAMVAEAPWQAVSSAIEFRFHGGPAGLADAVAMVAGDAESLGGISIFPTERDFENFASRHAAHRLDKTWTLWTAATERVDAVPAEEARRGEELGLVEDGRLFLLGGAWEEGTGPISAEEQGLTRIAVQGVVGACARHGAWLADRPTFTHVETDAGPLWVSSFEPGMEPPHEGLLVSAPCAVEVTDAEEGPDGGPVLSLRLAEGPAERMRAHLADVDAIGLELRARRRVALVAWAGAERVGVIGWMPDRDAWWALIGEATLAIEATGRGKGAPPRRLSARRVLAFPGDSRPER
jgi:hypothetical protein